MTRCNCEADETLCVGHSDSACPCPAGLAHVEQLGAVCNGCAQTYAADGYLITDTTGQLVDRK